MAVIGFIALALIGVAILVQGLGMWYVVWGFSGKSSWQALVVAAIGAAILYFTLTNAPFSLVVK